MSEDICPRCGSPIKYGIEYRGVYDGVLVWECSQGHQWPRFPAGDGRHQQALEQINLWAEP